MNSFFVFFSNAKKHRRGEISIRNKSMVRNNKNQELAQQIFHTNFCNDLYGHPLCQKKKKQSLLIKWSFVLIFKRFA